jgi:uncharacterized protein YqeY
VSLANTLQQDMKSALRSGAKLELSALRMLIAAIKKKEIEDQAELDDTAILGVIEKLIKQGRDAQQQFESAGREELAAKEAAEIEVFENYLPQALGAGEVEALIQSAIADTGASEAKDMGKVMGAIKANAAGRIDMGAVSKRVREILTGT